ncbi:hypothetical protein SAMN04488065_1476 [Haloplanus vescus]|uniref:Uncharacterized protein n=1 Tax=Haloplanus vescus TaxID=555874 RepID=A0A1H3XC17_9EURY|nr:hypothetical protein [Haloplanus vescus]SDZ96873.1 hypothetical protein SAMN04488065_1476 [Haloplanus vescus]
MDDAALLRQTIRRCTAVLVATIAYTGLVLQSTGTGEMLLLILTAALLYLGSEYVSLVPKEDTAEPPAESSPADDTREDDSPRS